MRAAPPRSPRCRRGRAGLRSSPAGCSPGAGVAPTKAVAKKHSRKAEGSVPPTPRGPHVGRRAAAGHRPLAGPDGRAPPMGRSGRCPPASGGRGSPSPMLDPGADADVHRIGRRSGQGAHVTSAAYREGTSGQGRGFIGGPPLVPATATSQVTVQGPRSSATHLGPLRDDLPHVCAGFPAQLHEPQPRSSDRRRHRLGRPQEIEDGLGSASAWD